MKELKYKYLYDKNKKLTYIEDAVKGELYYYEFSNIEFIVKEGLINRKHFSLKNSLNELSFGSGGESIAHYNAKMKIVHELKYYDTIFKKEIHFKKVVPKKKINNKIPDLSCYDDKGNLVLLIEICYKNKKTIADIDELKKIGVPTVEIDINDDNRCKHIILPALLENNRQSLRKIKSLFSKEVRKLEKDIDFAEIEYNKLADKQYPNIQRIKKEVGKYENYIESRRRDIARTIQEISELKKSIQSLKDKEYKDDYRLGKIEHEINRIKTDITKRESQVKESESRFKENAKRCKIEWFRPAFMRNDAVFNLTNEIKYWCS